MEMEGSPRIPDLSFKPSPSLGPRKPKDASRLLNFLGAIHAKPRHSPTPRQIHTAKKELAFLQKLPLAPCGKGVCLVLWATPFGWSLQEIQKETHQFAGSNL